jgi:hypothetical protein
VVIAQFFDPRIDPQIVTKVALELRAGSSEKYLFTSLGNLGGPNNRNRREIKG